MRSFVCLGCQDALFETEKCFYGSELEIRPKDLPKYILYQPFAAVSHSKDEFFLLQCRTPGANNLQGRQPDKTHETHETYARSVGTTGGPEQKAFDASPGGR